MGTIAASSCSRVPALGVFPSDQGSTTHAHQNFPRVAERAQCTPRSGMGHAWQNFPGTAHGAQSTMLKARKRYPSSGVYCNM